MHFLRKDNKTTANTLQRGLATASIISLAVLPKLAYASGGEDVALDFSGSNQLFLIASFVFGVIAVIYGLYLKAKVEKQSPGDESMQRVGEAIRSGAMAYLSQQGKTIAIFVVILAGLLGWLYASKYGTMLGIAIAGCFIAGVGASYLAGYVGMVMAVKANMRTAAAALTSFKKSLEVAFHAGAVAGMMTVGLGLIGATTIFYLGGANSMKLLVGFGFGGSLAALFMRVGGGIYTKAADVGADLVGKVEAGIPEDDPRNPAVIADNVGDNVGDCAGMAADVFESYEVTLVAAIVLGAATSSIFPQEVWMKLVLFALLARGVGVIASILGIMSVKGSDDLNSDPLKPISRGFKISGAIAILLTLVVSYFMMGGDSKSGSMIIAQKLSDPAGFDRTEQAKIRGFAKEYISANKDLAADTDFTALDQKAMLTFGPIAKYMASQEMSDDMFIGQVLARGLNADLEAPLAPLNELNGYSKVDWKDKRLANYSVMKGAGMGQAGEYASFVDEYGSTDPKKMMTVLRLKVETTLPAQGPEKPKVQSYRVFFGPMVREAGEKQIADAIKQSPSLKVDIQDYYQVHWMINKKGDLALGVDTVGEKIKDKFLDTPQRMSGFQGVNYYKKSAAEVKTAMDARAKDPASKIPAPKAFSVKQGILEYQNVEWWRFFACILFGIVLAFFFEAMTDYYVSTDKKPTREVAGVASAGPAPMIIQGFALGQESSVFSVFTISISLILPLLIFPPQQYNGYLLSFYGIALVGLGLLTTTGYILAMDTFGPISDNAQGVFEMSGAGHTHPEAARAVQRLDAAGNTTKALTKGFAIATAVVAAVALFHSFVESAQLSTVGMPLEVPEIFVGLMIGGAAPFLFSAFLINAVGRASFQLIGEVRRQFRNDPGIMAGTSTPDYGRCVAIVTSAAQKELLGPGIIAITLPLIVGFGLAIGKPTTLVNGQEYNLVGAQALGGFLAGTIVSGQLLAVMLANAGGIWDNAKKLIEDGMHGGKGTEAHKAGIVCDTVGDPFKDTAGPALNPLIKVMNLIALLLAPTMVAPLNDSIRIGITGTCIVALGYAIWNSKRSSLSSELMRLEAEAISEASVKG